MFIIDNKNVEQEATEETKEVVEIEITAVTTITSGGVIVIWIESQETINTPTIETHTQQQPTLTTLVILARIISEWKRWHRLQHSITASWQQQLTNRCYIFDSLNSLIVLSFDENSPLEVWTDCWWDWKLSCLRGVGEGQSGECCCCLGWLRGVIRWREWGW